MSSHNFSKKKVCFIFLSIFLYGKAIAQEYDVKKDLVRNDNQAKESLTNKLIKKYSHKTQLNKKLSEIKSNHLFLGVQETKDKLNQLIRENPHYHSAKVYLIHFLWQENDPEIINLLESHIENYPNKAIYRLSAARYYLEKSQNNLAATFLTDLPKELILNKNILQTRAIIRQKQNKHQLAISDYRSFANHHPINGSIHLAMGISFEALGENKMATISYQNAIRDSRLSSQQKVFLNKKLFVNKKNYDQGK